MEDRARDDGDRYCDPAVAARYDRLLADQVDDVRFYVEEAGREAGPVLEAGCGTGRVTLPIAEAGVRAVGLDRSAPMLEIAEAKRRASRLEVAARCAFVRGDLRRFAFRRPFGQAFLPFRVFQSLLTVPDQLAALASIRAALRPRGRLVFNVLDPRVELLADEGAPVPVRDTGRGYEADGARLRERYTARFSPLEQRLTLTFIYERRTPDGVVEREFEPVMLRYFHRFEIEHLLTRAGYEVEALYGDWDRGPFAENGQEMIWVARRT
ncbi:MAG TPA: class I SAM-dependent methyltransferase [Gemmatimonadota bacterium]|nr:class I SAM-dependent methyltransferase [Gemmatimonadota bacterium]